MGEGKAMLKEPFAYLEWKLAHAFDNEFRDADKTCMELGQLRNLHSCFRQMREALEYYAVQEHYTSGDVPGHIYAVQDGGRLARKALGRE
jgi:hypothetical protein